MADRENVINELNECIEHIRKNEFNKIPFWGNCQSAMMDALELLKEREAVEPTLIREGRNKNYNDYVCPRCDNEVVYEQNYCSECGVQFLWEGR